MSQQEGQMQERVNFGRRKLAKDANWSKLNLVIRSDRSLLMLFDLIQVDPTQVRMICQSLVPHLPNNFMSMADLTIFRSLCVRVNRMHHLLGKRDKSKTA